MHLDVGEELFTGILQAGPEEVDHIVDDEETVVVALGSIYINRWILLVVALDVELLLAGRPNWGCVKIVYSHFGASPQENAG